VLFTSEDVLQGQEVWQSIGGQQLGSIWGHGALQPPDWSADWLHWEAVAMIAALGPETARKQMRTNTHDAATNHAWITEERATVIRNLSGYYIALFMGAASAPGVTTDLQSLRALYALKDVTVYDEGRAAKLSAFVFWSSWACVTERPGQAITYTNNWPPERLVGNRPSADVIVWSMVSVALLVAGIGLLAWVKSGSRHTEELEPPESDPLMGIVVTPSMLSMMKWALTVCLLSAFQIGIGVYVAHLSVHGAMGIPQFLCQNVTYTVARTWHLQAAILSIATSFLAAGLFLAPVLGGWTKDPPLQLLGCNALFCCLLVIVVGSFLGELAAVKQLFESMLMSQWFGHQGYEYVDLGRFYQWFLFAGLLIWLALMLNGVWPALFAPRSEAGARGNWHLVTMFTSSGVLIALFWSAGFMYSARTNLAIMDYWRFWIVHMWVEGIFEVFITVVVAHFFVKLGVLDATGAAGTTLFGTGVFLFGGIPGMFHHNYWSGTPTLVLAVGACFSVLEVAPLALMGFEASEYWSVLKAASTPAGRWLQKYAPIIDCFIYVAFWNLVGAGFLGFIINPPISLYYMQGGYLTLAHSHGALWGVYGMLALALVLLVIRLADLRATWRTWSLNLGLRLMNVGMVLQILLSIFPIGLYQFWTAVNSDYWYARSHHFHGQSVVQWLKLARAAGDSMFGVGILFVCYFVATVTLPFITGKARLAPRGEGLLGLAE